VRAQGGSNNVEQVRNCVVDRRMQPVQGPRERRVGGERRGWQDRRRGDRRASETPRFDGHQPAARGDGGVEQRLGERRTGAERRQSIRRGASRDPFNRSFDVLRGRAR
jgi:hypothetical protein